MKTKKLLAFVLVAVMMLSVSIASFADAALEPVKIIVVGCLTGNNAESGRMTRIGAEAAVRFINENGGISGRPVEMILVDSTSDPAQSPIAVEDALTKNPDVVAIVGNSTSSATLPMLPVLQEYGVPAVAMTAANGTITEQGCDYIFQPCHIGAQSTAMQIEFIGYLAGKLGKDISEVNFGIVFENSAWGQDVCASSKNLAEANGYNVVVEETYPAAALTDASSLVSKLKNAEVDVIFPAMYPTDAKLIMTAMAAADFKPIIVGSGSALVWTSFVRDVGADANGICSATAWNWDSKFVRNNELFTNEIMPAFEELNDEFMGEQVGPAFICMMMVKEAIENGDCLERGTTAEIRDAIRDEIFKLTGENSPWFAMLNPNSAFNEKGGNIGARPMIAQWQDGKLRAVYPEDVASGPVLDPLTLEPLSN